MKTSPATMSGWLILEIGLLVALWPGHRQVLGAGHDGLARGAIFAGQHTRDAALPVHREALTMTPERRFDFLVERVLPGHGSDQFRLSIDFSPTQPAPPVQDAAELQIVQEAARRGLSRIWIGGELVSPALDLVDVAAELGRLPELRARIEAARPVGEIQQRCQLAMLELIDLAREDVTQALSHFDELFTRVLAGTREEFSERWPETLAVQAAIRHPQTREVAAEMLNQMIQSQVRSGVARGPDAWDRWATAAFWRVYGKQPSRPDDVLKSWGTSSRMNGWSRGNGLPAAVWSVNGSEVQNLASHDDDYLYYRIPLSGTFDVECEVSSFGWRDSHLMFAGTYVAPIYDHITYGLGSIRSSQPAGSIDPPLSLCDEWIRYRVVVRDRTAQTYFNGRLIHTERLRPGHDPWLAIRSASYADGGVRHLTIRGAPIIPERIVLSNSPTLTGWHAYHGEPVDGPQAYWRHEINFLTGGIIVGQRESWLNGLGVERLLSYHRPMLEDGSIEYSFFFQNGRSSVSPALDRRAFVITPDGVSEHWITDGFFDRTDLSPTETTILTARPLPLRDNAWNQLRLTLKGDAVELVLNNESVYQGEIDPANQRTFGLFHWADQTEARVQNIVWKGNWPKSLPPVEEQELAGEGIRFLDQDLPGLTATFEHNFATDGLPDRLIQVTGESAKATVLPGQGIRVALTNQADYREAYLSPRFQLTGNFDVSVRFADFATSGPKDSSCGIYLMAILDDPQTTHSGIYRGILRKPGTADRQVTQAEFNRGRSGNRYLTWPVSTAEECTSGTLRLARRGNLLHCLLAEGDSQEFRLVHTEEITAAPTLFGGLRLMSSSSQEPGGTCLNEVTWQHLTVRAEQITTPGN